MSPESFNMRIMEGHTSPPHWGDIGFRCFTMFRLGARGHFQKKLESKPPTSRNCWFSYWNRSIIWADSLNVWATGECTLIRLPTWCALHRQLSEQFLPRAKRSHRWLLHHTRLPPEQSASWTDRLGPSIHDLRKISLLASDRSSLPTSHHSVALVFILFSSSPGCGLYPVPFL